MAPSAATRPAFLSAPDKPFWRSHCRGDAVSGGDIPLHRPFGARVRQDEIYRMNREQQLGEKLAEKTGISDSSNKSAIYNENCKFVHRSKVNGPRASHLKITDKTNGV